MLCAVLIFALPLLVVQDKPSKKDIPALIERMGSESIEERERAASELKGVGENALPQLQEALFSEKKELAVRVRQVINDIAVERFLREDKWYSSRDPSTNIGHGNDHTFACVFKALSKRKDIQTRTLNAFVSQALQEASKKGQAIGICITIRDRQLDAAIPALVRRLETDKHFDGSVRNLGPGLNYEEYQSTLSRRLGHMGAVRGYCTALASLGAFPELWSFLTSDCHIIRSSALASLGGLEENGVVAPFAKLFRKPQEQVRNAPARAAMIPFTKLFRDPHEDVRSASARAAAALGAREHWEGIAGLIQDPHKEVGVAALKALAELGATEAIPMVLAGLGNKDSAKEAARTVVALGAVKSAPEIVGHFKSENAVVRRCAIEAIKGLHARAVVPDLVGMLKDPSRWVRVAAMRTLADLGTRKTTLPLLMKLMEDKEIGRNVILSLGQMEATGTIPAMKDLLNRKPEWRATLVRALADMNSREALRECSKLFESSKQYDRLSAIWAVGELRERSFIPQLRKCLGDPEYWVRHDAIKTLARLNATEAIPDLARALTQRDASNRADAAQALGEMQAMEHRNQIERLLEDESRYVRQVAAGVLCMMDSKRGIPVIVNSALGSYGSDLMDEFYRRLLISVNAVRDRSGWSRLRARKVERDLEGSFPKVITNLCRQGGFKCQLPASIERAPWKDLEHRIRSRQRRTSLLEAIGVFRCKPNGTTRCIQDGKESDAGVRGVYRITAPL